jgi:hypothetical protein
MAGITVPPLAVAAVFEVVDAVGPDRKKGPGSTTPALLMLSECASLALLQAMSTTSDGGTPPTTAWKTFVKP